VFDNVMCGGPDGSYTSSAVPITAAAVNMVKAAIFLGDPHYNYNANLPFQVGTCRASGVCGPTSPFPFIQPGSDRALTPENFYL
jgi:acetylxylan esterase